MSGEKQQPQNSAKAGNTDATSSELNAETGAIEAIGKLIRLKGKCPWCAGCTDTHPEHVPGCFMDINASLSAAKKDLESETPTPQDIATRKGLEATLLAAMRMLETCRSAFKSLGIRDLGEGRDDKGMTWPIRDELIDNVNKTIRAISAALISSQTTKPVDSRENKTAVAPPESADNRED